MTDDSKATWGCAVIVAIVVGAIVLFSGDGNSPNRSYGDSYQDQVYDLEDQIQELENQISELESCNDTLRSQLEDSVFTAEYAIGEDYYDSQDALEEISYNDPDC